MNGTNLGYRRTFFGFLGWLSLATFIFADGVKLLHVEHFDDGRVLGWKFYDNSLDYYDPDIDTTVTHRDSQGALLGQSNASGLVLVKLLRQASLTIPIENDVYLCFAFYCEADQPEQDEISIYLEGHDKAGMPIHRTIPVALHPTLNHWHHVSIPMSACGTEALQGQMDGVMYISWDRGTLDAHNLRIDDFQISRGSQVRPTILHPGTFQITSDGIRISEGHYWPRLKISAQLYRDLPWKVELLNPQQKDKRVWKTYQGTGRQVKVHWNGQFNHDELIDKKQVEIRLTVDPASLGHDPIVQSTTVSIDSKACQSDKPGPYVILKEREPIDFDHRTAMCRILLPGNRIDDFVLVEESGIQLCVEPGSRSGLRLKLIRPDGNPGDANSLNLSTADLSASRGEAIISSANVHFKTVSQTPLDFGFTLQETRAVQPPLSSSHVLELSVKAPAYLPPGSYLGSITIGRSKIPLDVTVTARSAPRRWWQDEKIRLMLAKPQVMPRQENFYDSNEGYRQISRAGFNVMIPYINLKDQLFITGKAESHDLMSIARTKAPAYPQDGFHEPYFVWPTGIKTQLMCPFSEDFWQEAMTPQALHLAQVSTSVAMVGMEFDFEIYVLDGQDKFAHIYCHCYCDACWDAMGNDDPTVAELNAADRHPWLRRHHRLGAYKVLQDNRLRQHARRLRQAVDEINPDLQFMLLPWRGGDFLQILAEQWGTPQTPVILSVETTYGRGRTPLNTSAALANNRNQCINGLREAKRRGFQSLFVPGVMPGYQKADPAFCRANAEILSRTSDGYWVFFQQVQDPSTVADNMEAFRRANATIVSGNDF